MELEEYLNLDPDVHIINKSQLEILNGKSPIEITKIKLRGNFLFRQEIKNITPICSIKCIMIYHLIFIICYMSISIPILAKSKNNYYEIDYTNCNIEEDFNGNKICNLTITIQKDLTPPIYVYYKLENFYINYRLYVKSKSFKQLRGEEINIDSECSDMSKYKDLFGDDKSLYLSYTNEILNESMNMNPCGLQARVYFNDSFTLYKENKIVEIIETGIAYKSDKKYKFKNNKNSEKIQWLNKENEHFMVWMNMESFNNFIKKWGYINVKLNEGIYILKINKNWGKSAWNVNKKFVIVKTERFGNENFFGIVLLIASISDLAIILIMCFYGLEKKKFKPEMMKWD
jgi:hypothetical protein